MTIGKRNEFLNLPDSDDDHESAYESENEPIKGRPAAKRRRLSLDSDVNVGTDDDEDDGIRGLGDTQDDKEHGAEEDSEEKAQSPAIGDGGAPEGQNEKAGEDSRRATKPKLKLHVEKPLAHKNLITTDQAIKKSGVIYLSRIPPFLKPSKLRSLLAPYGSLNRIFLSPEDPATHARRVRAGGNKKRSFTEGWVEFVRKKDAKRAVELLNTRPIGGRKGSYYRDDIWSMIYLHGFKWRDLTGQVAAENAERASRMRAELARAAKSDKEFVQNYEKSKQITGIEKKRKERASKDAETDAGPEKAASSQGQGEVRRTFRQVPLAKKRKMDDEGPSAEAQRALSGFL